MAKTSRHKSPDQSDDDDTYALNALKDLDGISSDSELDIDKLNISSNHERNFENNVTEEKEKLSNTSKKSSLKSRHVQNNKNKSNGIRNSTYSDVSTPPMDSKSLPVNSKETPNSNRSYETDVSYTPDFTEDNGLSNDDMTPWEKWFVVKQKEIRRRSEIEKKKKVMEEQRVKQLQEKKAEDNERRQKLWLERKKLEENAKKEKDKETKVKCDKGSTASEYRFEKWYLKKIQEKKSQLQNSQELQKYEELKKEMRRKKNEKAQSEWMDKAKQRPMTPRITYAYVGDSVIGFYDSTSHPPPTYINPIPWQP